MLCSTIQTLDELDDAFPSMTWSLEGGDLELRPKSYLWAYPTSPGSLIPGWCLGLMDNGPSAALLGGLTFRDIAVTYNVRDQQIEFTPTSCALFPSAMQSAIQPASTRESSTALDTIDAAAPNATAAAAAALSPALPAAAQDLPAAVASKDGPLVTISSIIEGSDGASATPPAGAGLRPGSTGGSLKLYAWMMVRCLSSMHDWAVDSETFP